MKKIYVLFLFTMVLPMIIPSHFPPLTGGNLPLSSPSLWEGLREGILSNISGFFSLSAKTITITPKKGGRRQDTNVFDIYYDLPPSKFGYKWAYLYYSTDMKHYKRAKGAKGDVGKNIRAGKDKHIIWNAEIDFPTEYDGNIDVVVKAKKISIPSGMKFIGKNNKGYYEVKNSKDGSILIYIPAGEFTMGSENGDSDEKPVHKVYLDGYYIGKYEVTFEQYDRFCEATGRVKPDNEGWGRGNRPVINVSWNDAVAYCKWAGLRLPTEAEWEKAARGGENYKYAGSNNPDEVAWYDNNSGNYTHPVGQKKANGYGTYDMSGNVWEWCSDWYDSGYYSNSPYRNPKGPASGSSRVYRGGSWDVGARNIRCAVRYGDTSDSGNCGLGFRVARSP